MAHQNRAGSKLSLPEENSTNQVTLLAELTTRLDKSTSEQCVYDIAARYIPALIQCDRSSITLLNDTQTALELISLTGVKGASQPGRLIALQNTTIESAINSQAIVN